MYNNETSDSSENNNTAFRDFYPVNQPYGFVGIEINEDKWFTNLTKVGNVGSASIYIILEELFHSGKLKKGEKILVMVPESGRFSYAYAYLTVE